MALTDTAIRKARPREKAYKLADSQGLYLLINPGGSKAWLVKYRIDGVERLQTCCHSIAEVGLRSGDQN